MLQLVSDADEAGGAWLDWLGHAGGSLRWPLPYAWTVSSRRFPVKHDLYHADEDVLAFMMNRNVVVALFRKSPEARRHLADMFALACGRDTEQPKFVLPWKGQ